MTSLPPPRDLHVLDDEAQLRVLANPERGRILRLLVDAQGTAAQIADRLGGTRGRVHYHVKLLEQAGLIEIVDRVERGGVTEKHYRAVAQNFCLARGIGEHAGLSDEVRGLVSESMLAWRRAELLDVDPVSIARRILVDCLAVEPGHLLVIQGDHAQREIIEVLTAAIDAIGAEAFVTYRGARPPGFLVPLADRLHAAIVLDEPLDRLREGAPPDVSTEAGLDALAARATSFHHATSPGDPMGDPVWRALIEAGVRTVYFAYPTAARAEGLGLDHRDLHDACWRSIDLDYRALAAEADRLRDELRVSEGSIHVRSAGGTDLRVELHDDDVYTDDGVISEWEVRHRRGWGHLPAGKLIVPVRKGSARGSIHCEAVEYLGVSIRGVRLSLHDGAVAHATAEEHEALLRRILDAGEGDHRVISGIEFGLNPGLPVPVGYSVWDTKCRGDVTVALGDNRVIGGDCRSNMAWSLGIRTPRVSLDDRPWLDADRDPSRSQDPTRSSS